MNEWIAKVTKWVNCSDSPLGESAVSRSLFVRALSLVYLIAVISWWVQMGGLVGSEGLVPANEYLERVEAYGIERSENAFFLVPTVFLWSCSDPVMHGVCLLAIMLALLVMAGFFQGPLLFILWFLYLSLVTTGSVFMNFQWDALLLEVGLLAVLVAPWKARVSWRQPDLNVPRWSWYLLRWLLFRLMFFAGYVKLTSGDSSWWDGTAMLFHYETQPLPPWTAWWMYQLPDWFNRFTCGLMLVIEIILPFLIFMGKRMRLIAAIGMVSLMLLISVTGNYTYFNFLTIVLCFSLVSDIYWPRLWLKRAGIQLPSGKQELVSKSRYSTATWLGVGGRGLACVYLLLLSLIVVSGQLLAGGTFTKQPLPQLALTMTEAVTPFRSVNAYGLFRVMTKERPEIIFEGSRDGRQWEEYRLKYKPGKLEQRPRFVAPHQPRLDWQLWFAALERKYHPQSRNAAWINALMLGLLNGSPQVLAFFDYQPFGERPPKYVRAKLYLYKFTDLSERKKTGRWWKRKTQALYFPEIRKQK